MLVLEKSQCFEVDKEKKMGHMRCDFQSGTLANSWFPAGKEEIEETEKTEIQSILNEIMFDRLYSYDAVVELCEGEGYKHRTNRFVHKESLFTGLI